MNFKKLFFVVSSLDVLKNFFLFKESLFDRLKPSILENRLRVILLVPSFLEKHVPDLINYSNNLGNKVEIELIPSDQKVRGIQKIFTFFYSYLIYTGTTKTLATMGMRPDDAPDGGRMYLAPVKVLVANTFGRFGFVKNKLVPFLYDFFFPERPLLNIFQKHKPDLVFAPNLFKRFDRDVLREAKRQQVKSVGMVMNWDHLDKYFLPFHPNKFLAQSDQTKFFALKYQRYNDNEVEVVGYPYLDFVLDKKYAVSRNELLKQLGFPENSKYILYVAGSMYCPDEPDVIEKMLEWADKKELGEDVRFVIRPYPGGRGRDLDFDIKKFEGFENHPRVSFSKEKFWIDAERSAYFMNMMRHASAIIAVYSTSALEAAALDRPILTTAFDGYKQRPFHRSVRRFELREHFGDLLKTGGLRSIYGFPELLFSLKDYLKDDTIDAEKREAMRQRVIYKTDGKSTERVLKNILSFLGL